MKIAHSQLLSLSDVMRLAFGENNLVMCKKGEPGKRLSAGTTYYTSESRICKYSNVTKIDVNFCEKGTE
jgi:hypothetical protein